MSKEKESENKDSSQPVNFLPFNKRLYRGLLIFVAILFVGSVISLLIGGLPSLRSAPVGTSIPKCSSYISDVVKLSPYKKEVKVKLQGYNCPSKEWFRTPDRGGVVLYFYGPEDTIVEFSDGTKGNLLDDFGIGHKQFRFWGEKGENVTIALQVR